MNDTKQFVLTALDSFANQRPGLDPRNYGNWKGYRSEARDITRDLSEFRKLSRYVEWRDEISADDIVQASRNAFSGRLTLNQGPNGVSVDYVTGQYWPTEYRKAACSVLASAIWARMRDDAPHFTAQDLRKACHAEFGRAIASRWFR